MTLPEWLAPVDGKPGTFEIDVDVYCPLALEEIEPVPMVIGEAQAPVREVDQYLLEIAYQFAKLDAMAELRRAKLDPRPKATLTLLMRCEDKERWAQRNFPPGRFAELRAKHGVDQARTAAEMQAAERAAEREVAKEARRLYIEKRGFIPA